MSRKYDIVVDRSGKGRSITVVNKETGAVVGTSGAARPGAPVVSAATIRRREQPQDFVLPKRKIEPEVEVDSEVEEQQGEQEQEERLVVSPEEARRQRMLASLSRGTKR